MTRISGGSGSDDMYRRIPPIVSPEERKKLENTVKRADGGDVVGEVSDGAGPSMEQYPKDQGSAYDRKGRKTGGSASGDSTDDTLDGGSNYDDPPGE